MNLIQDVLAAAAKSQDGADHFCRIPLVDILPDKINFYGLHEIEELAAAIDAYGLDQPLVVRPAGQVGKYTLTGGHRRRAALLLLAQKDPDRWETVDVKMTSSLGDLADRARLIALNKTARKETEYEQMREVVELAEIAKAWKAQGGAVSGKLREAVAKSVGMSSGQVGKYQAIHAHLTPSFMDSYRSGLIGTPVAYELSGLPAERQEKLAAENPAPTLEQVRTAKTASAISVPRTPAEPEKQKMEHKKPSPEGQNAVEVEPCETRPLAQDLPVEIQRTQFKIEKIPVEDIRKIAIVACAWCGNGEYLHNENGSQNAYCGHCGNKIAWPELKMFHWNTGKETQREHKADSIQHRNDSEDT